MKKKFGSRDWWKGETFVARLWTSLEYAIVCVQCDAEFGGIIPYSKCLLGHATTKPNISL